MLLVYSRRSANETGHGIWWTEEVAKAVGEKREAWKMIHGFRGGSRAGSLGAAQQLAVWG